MIVLHRLGQTAGSFRLNPDLVVTVESVPDTVVTLTTGARIMVDETPDEVVDAIRGWRVSIAGAALRVPADDRARRGRGGVLSAIEGPPPGADQSGG